MDNKEFLAEKTKYFKTTKGRWTDDFDEQRFVRVAIEGMTENQFFLLKSSPTHGMRKMAWISFCLGLFGVDRFMIGDVKLGVAKLVLCWALIPWFVDWFFFIDEAVRKYNRKYLNTVLGYDPIQTSINLSKE